MTARAFIFAAILLVATSVTAFAQDSEEAAWLDDGNDLSARQLGPR